MTSITAALFKATVSLLVNKGQDSREKMSEGDLTDPNFREFIVREIDDVAKGLERNRDLSGTTTCFRQGIVHLLSCLKRKKATKTVQLKVQ